MNLCLGSQFKHIDWCLVGRVLYGAGHTESHHTSESVQILFIYRYGFCNLTFAFMEMHVAHITVFNWHTTFYQTRDIGRVIT